MNTKRIHTIITVVGLFLLASMLLGIIGGAHAAPMGNNLTDGFSKITIQEKELDHKANSNDKKSAGSERKEKKDEIENEDSRIQKDVEESANLKSSAEITVNASSTVRLTPDRASVFFGVTTQESTAADAQNKNSETVRKIIEVLTERGIDKNSIRTTDYSMYPQYNSSDDGTEKISGYYVYTTMSIQNQELKDIGKLFSDVVAAGVNNINNISFLCSEYDQAYNNALSDALQTAREKAKTIAEAAGKELGEVISITEGVQDTSLRYGQFANVSFDGMNTEEYAASAPTLMPGSAEITANMTATFRIK